MSCKSPETLIFVIKLSLWKTISLEIFPIMYGIILFSATFRFLPVSSVQVYHQGRHVSDGTAYVTRGSSKGTTSLNVVWVHLKNYFRLMKKPLDPHSCWVYGSTIGTFPQERQNDDSLKWCEIFPMKLKTRSLCKDSGTRNFRNLSLVTPVPPPSFLWRPKTRPRVREKRRHY